MRLRKGFVIREICGEKVLSAEGSECIDFNKLIRLNETAAFLLESIIGKTKCDEVQNEMRQNFTNNL